MGRLTALLLILAAAVLGTTLYLANPKFKRERDFGLEKFGRDVEIILAGDVMLGRTVMTKSLDLNDPTYPFAKVAGKLRAADIVFVNLENPMIKNCPRDYVSLKFCADPKMAEGLIFAGVDIVNLANNHSRDYGREGLEETKKILTEKGIKWVGDDEFKIVTAKGTKFGFLGFDLTIRPLIDADLEQTKSADKKVDVLIVAVHWGVEYTREPTKSQKLIAKKLVAAGADVIAGHHPHWVQGVEYHHPGVKPVFYSLGNFVFDQMWSQKTREGLAVSLTYREGELKRIEEHPTFMENWSQPEFIK